MNKEQEIADEARSHAKEVMQYFSSTEEAYKLRAKNSYQMGYEDALKKFLTKDAYLKWKHFI